jgi:hypothetical protein
MSQKVPEPLENQPIKLRPGFWVVLAMVSVVGIVMTNSEYFSYAYIQYAGEDRTALVYNKAIQVVKWSSQEPQELPVYHALVVVEPESINYTTSIEVSAKDYEKIKAGDRLKVKFIDGHPYRFAASGLENPHLPRLFLSIFGVVFFVWGVTTNFASNFRRNVASKISEFYRRS